MKKVTVFDVPASFGGAMTILKSFYEEAVKNTDIQWLFVVSTNELVSQNNVIVKSFPWVKKSWFHRLFFDKFYAPKIVKKSSCDLVISLQNTYISTSKKEILYVHQPIPFADIRFSFANSPKLWIYQNVISKIIRRSIRKTDLCVVQTNWMKKSILDQTNVEDKRVAVVKPPMDVKISEFYTDNDANRKVFFYPAAPNNYKNHGVVIDAVKILIKDGIKDFKVIFTINPCGELDGRKIENLPQFELVGTIPHTKVMNLYSQSTLVFPSKLESFGLPMLEAALVGGRILASDMSFSREILDEYVNVDFFKADSAETLAEQMKKIICNDKKYQSVPAEWYEKHRPSTGWSKLIDMLESI